MLSNLISSVIKKYNFNTWNELRNYLTPYLVDGYIEFKCSFCSDEWVDRYDMIDINHVFEVYMLTKNMKSQ